MGSNDWQETSDVRVLRETEKAILVEGPDIEDDTWVPKSVISDDSDVYDNSDEGCGPGRLIVKLWFAEKEGW